MTEILTFPEDDFTDEIALLYAPLRNYVAGIIPLMLEHIWLLKEQNGSSASTEMMQSVWICRLITLDKRVSDPEKQTEILGWPELRNQMAKCIDDCKDETQLSNMIRDCMQLVEPVLEKRFVDGYRFPERPFHCWWYTIHDDDTHMAIHLVNAYQPQSPFEHLHDFLTTMLDAVKHALTIYPGIRIVSCGSWLNQVPKFQQIWPAGFQYNQTVLNVTGGFGPGAWGQYMTVEGGFNQGKANVLRKTGKHPFVLTEAQSPIDEVISHLIKIIPDALLKTDV